MEARVYEGDWYRGAVFSNDRTYRYSLWRKWASGPGLTFVGLNPSTADAKHNDPTVERCERRARKLGAGSLVVVNLFALRSTNPKKMLQHKDPIGHENDMFIMTETVVSKWVLFGWGNHGAHMNRSKDVIAMLKKSAWAPVVEPVCLGINASGEPKHPLYVSYKTKLRPFNTK